MNVIPQSPHIKVLVIERNRKTGEPIDETTGRIVAWHVGAEEPDDPSSPPALHPVIWSEGHPVAVTHIGSPHRVEIRYLPSDV